MSTEQNKALLRRWIEAFRPGNLSTLEQLADECYTADSVLHDPDWPDLPPGPEGVKQFVRRVFKDSPDTKVTIEDLVAEGDRVASRITVSSTDAATGKPKRFLVMAISRFAGGKIAEEWEIGIPATSEAHDPVAVVNALDAACNAGDIERVMALFTVDAILKDPVEPKVHTGKQQIRAWFQPQMGHFHVTSTDHRVTGNTVTWRGALTGDIIREMGSDVIEESAEAVVQGGKITSFALTIVGRKP